MTKAYKQLNKNDHFRILPFELFDDKGSNKDGAEAIPSTVHLIPIGQWEHDLYGPIIINSSDIREFVQNFNAEVRKGVYITCGHEGWEEYPAAGWIKSVEAHDDGLWGEVEWNEHGKEALGDKQYKFFSPELVRDYEDPQTHQFYRNVLIGGALTKSPYFKELKAIMFSDKKLQTNFNDSGDMNIQELLAKDITTLTDEEKTFIREHQAELTDEQKQTVASVLEDSGNGDQGGEGDSTKTTTTTTDDKGQEGGDGAEDPNKTQVNASDKNVTISASEYSALKEKANQGAQAFAALEKSEIAASVAKMTFSESNRVGKFLPKSQGKLESFMKKLSKSQREEFSALVSEIPDKNIFDEKGSGNFTEGTAKAEVETKVKAFMEKNATATYADALKTVFAENPQLTERYNAEVSS